MRSFLILLFIFIVISPASAATKNLVPNATGDGGLGTATKQWREVNAVTGAFSAKLTLGGEPVATTNQAGVIALDVAQQVVATNSSGVDLATVNGLLSAKLDKNGGGGTGIYLTSSSLQNSSMSWSGNSLGASYTNGNVGFLDTENLWDNFTISATGNAFARALLSAPRVVANTFQTTLGVSATFADFARGVVSTNLSSDLPITHSTNRVTGLAQFTTLYLYAGVTNRLVSFNTNWVLWGCGPTNLVASNHWCAVHLMAIGPAENNVHVRFDPQ